MNYKEVYAGDYLTAKAWPDNQVAKVVIEHVELSSLTDRQTGKEKPQLVLHFRNTEKKLGLNVTNADTLGDAFGDDTDGWLGKRIQIHKVKIRSFGEVGWSLQIRIPEQTTVAAAPAPPGYANAPLQQPADDGFHATHEPVTPPSINRPIDDDGFDDDDNDVPF